MMLSVPLQPRNGHTLKVLMICRVSDPRPGKQDERSLDDQEALLREWLSRNTQFPVEVQVIAGKGSGEYLDRKESREACEAIESGEFDVVLCEDLGRIFRRMQAYDFCDLCEDFNTRLIALNDGVDTGVENWRWGACFAALRHEASNSDTAKRIRRAHRSRFPQGGVFQVPIYGYIKPPGTKSDTEVSKDPAAETIYGEWFTRLENGATFSEIADWLNEQGVPVGPGCRREQWNCRMVAGVTRNPILKGIRVRNKRMSKRINKTGRRKSVKAPPEERLERECPHLAFIEPERYDRVIRMLEERNAKYRRNGKDGRDMRSNIPRKRTRFPGQLIECGICGHRYVFGGHGQTDHLMCDGAREYKCWNGTPVDGPLAARKIPAAVLSEIEALPDFDTAFLEKVNAEADRIDADRMQKQHEYEQHIRRLDRELDNVMRFIREGNASPRLHAEIARLEDERRQFQRLLDELQAMPRSAIELPSIDELKSLARSELSAVADDCWALQPVMRRLIPKIVVFPYRLCDGGKIVLRAKFRLHLVNLLDAVRAREVLEQPLERILCVDLFDPPQREKFREQVVRRRTRDERGRRQTERAIARELGITVTAAQRAAGLQRKMDAEGLDDPYVLVTEPPDNSTKLRRHRHSRYHFDPLPHAGQL